MASMSPSRPPLLIDLAAAWSEAVAGVWFPITVTLKRPDDGQGSVCVRNIDCADKGVQLDTDLFQRDVQIWPGEAYRFVLRVLVPRARTVDLKSVGIEVPGESDLVDFPDRVMEVRPALAREVTITEEAICSYGDVTKLKLTFRHEGETHFEDFSVRLSPEGAVQAGKVPIVWPAFKPNDTEQVVVAASQDLELTMTALVDQSPVSARRSISIPRGPGRKEAPLFRFLEPRRLSADNVVIRESSRKGAPLGLVRSTYHLTGGKSYQVVIRPQEDGVKDIVLHDIPGLIYVRNGSKDAEEGGWTFDIDVAYGELLSKPERLYYKVETSDETLTGEIYLTLQAPESKRWKFALAVGVAATVQGLAAITHRLLRPDAALDDLFTDFRLERDYHLLFLFSIPLVWFGTWAYDRLQARLRQ
jgi:hypothetical protein